LQIEGFWVSGFRSLAEIEEIPVGNPTIVTGQNDGGKTALLEALQFLLSGAAPSEDDRTLARDGDDPPGGVEEERFGEVRVTGRFTLSPAEQEQLALPSEILVRRRGGVQPPTLEHLVQVPEDPNLRALEDSLPLVTLKERAAALGLEPQGSRSHKRSYLDPLRELATQAPRVEEWVLAPRPLADALPRLLQFASTREPDPEREIRTSLSAIYGTLLEDDQLLGPVRAAEKRIQQRLQTEAEALTGHIKLRCPELTDIQIVPAVSFEGGFTGVTLLAGRGEDTGVSLRASGAGRRRRITLAVWEWSTNLVAGSDDRPVLIAYDEPDTHLDYGHQRKLVDLIRLQASLPGTRVIVATHSLNLIDKVDIENVIHLTLDEGRTVVHRLAGGEHAEIDRFLTNIASEMGLRNSVLLHERCFVAVEGATEAQAFPILFRTSTGFSLQAAGLALISGSGNEGALKVARFLNDHGRKIHFVVDKDSATSAGSRKVFRPEALKAHGIGDDQVHFVGNPDELEDLFTDAQWAETANEAWPRDDGDPWTEADFGALRKSGKRFSAALEALVRGASSSAPLGKPGYVLTLARRLSSAEEVPTQLRAVFQELLEMAST
jgi:putative ATP-dependent endonuclease of OLD family